MKYRLLLALSAASLFSLLCFPATSVFAQSGAPTLATPPTTNKLYAPLPAGLTAEKILDRFLQVSGGKDASAKVKTTCQKGIMSLAVQNLKGDFELYMKQPNRFYTAQTFEGIGKTEVGFDGKIAWSKDPINGIRLLQGSEMAQLKRQIESESKRGSDWRTAYKKVEALGVRKVDGKDAYAIRLTPATGNGKPIVQYFSPETGLLVRLDMIQQGAQGTFPIESYFSDYRTVDGQKIPFLVRQKVAAAEIVTTITEVKNNLSIPDSKFAKP